MLCCSITCYSVFELPERACVSIVCVDAFLLCLEQKITKQNCAKLGVPDYFDHVTEAMDLARMEVTLLCVCV